MEPLDKFIYVRITATDWERLQAMTQRLPLRPSALARLAIQKGLEVLEINPSAIVIASPAKRKATRRRG